MHHHIHTNAGKHKGISTTEKTLVCWFIVTGLIHFVIEGAVGGAYRRHYLISLSGYVVVTPTFFKDTTGCLLAEICTSTSTMHIKRCISAEQGRSMPKQTRAMPHATRLSSLWKQ